MARSQQTFNKKEREKKKKKKLKEKLEKREEKRGQEKNSLDDMIAYVDENGVIMDTPPDPAAKSDVEAENIEIGIPPSTEEEDDTKKGRVEFFNEMKGFGFIKDSSSGEKYFVHANGLLEPITEGDLVEFEITRGKRGMDAVKVKKSK